MISKKGAVFIAATFVLGLAFFFTSNGAMAQVSRSVTLSNAAGTSSVINFNWSPLASGQVSNAGGTVSYMQNNDGTISGTASYSVTPGTSNPSNADQAYSARAVFTTFSDSIYNIGLTYAQLINTNILAYNNIAVATRQSSNIATGTLGTAASAISSSITGFNNFVAANGTANTAINAVSSSLATTYPSYTAAVDGTSAFTATQTARQTGYFSVYDSTGTLTNYYAQIASNSTYVVQTMTYISGSNALPNGVTATVYGAPSTTAAAYIATTHRYNVSIGAGQATSTPTSN